MMSLTKNPHPSFTGYVALTEPDKFPRKATCNPVVLAREFPISAGRESVKKVLKLQLTVSVLNFLRSTLITFCGSMQVLCNTQIS